MMSLRAVVGSLCVPGPSSVCLSSSLQLSYV